MSNLSSDFSNQIALVTGSGRGGGYIVNIGGVGSFRTLPDYVVVGVSNFCAPRRPR